MTYVLFTIIAMMSSLASCASSSTAPAADRSHWALMDKNAAAEATLRYVPETRTTAVQIAQTAELVTMQDCRIGFIADSINGKSCWRITVEVEMNLTLKRPLDELDTRRRTFELLLDPVTGRLVGASCVLSTDYPNREERPSAETLTQRLEAHREVIHSFAEREPAITFIEALNFVVGSVYGAKEIYIWHVDYSRYNYRADEYEPAHPVWWIDLRGIPPIDPKEPPITHYRSVIDSQTGVHICSTNLEG